MWTRKHVHAYSGGLLHCCVGSKQLLHVSSLTPEHHLHLQDPEKVKDPVEFVQQLLTQKDKFDAIVLRSFQNDKAFQNALNQAFEHFINLNQRSPEYISLFMDDKLRKGLKVGRECVTIPGICALAANSQLLRVLGLDSLETTSKQIPGPNRAHTFCRAQPRTRQRQCWTRS